MSQKKSTKTRSRRSPKSRKPRSSKAASSARRRPLRRALFVLVLLAITGAAGLFVAVDHGVRARLASPQQSGLPVVYSAPIDLAGLVSRMDDAGPGQLSRLRAVLQDRRYTEVSGNPTRPGDFSVSATALSIVTRPYRNASGADVQSRKAVLLLNEPPHERLLLEPQVISYFNAPEVRASTFTPISQIPKVMQQAVIAIEDERFYDHFGIDLISVLRALATNVMAGRLVQGGSTLTQQLAKNLFLSPKRTIGRKLMEIPTALSLEYRLTKDQLLELYLNEVYLGQEGAVAIHGMPEAANALFGKQIGDISPDEAALLAGIIKAPSSYNPRKHPERAKERRDIVLAKMQELAFLSEAQYEKARRQPLRIVQQQEHRRIAPFYAQALESDLKGAIDMDSFSSGGLAIYTGLDLGMQRCAEAAVSAGISKLESAHPKLSAAGKRPETALVAIEPYSGLVKAWVGGRDFGSSQFNRVSQGMRQIGSTIKPFLYLAALDGSLNSYKVASPVSILEDQPHEVKLKHQAAWNPENYDHKFRGDVTLRYALENSLNMPALYIAERIGLSALRRTVSAFRLSDAAQQVPSLALGALDTNLLRLTAAYGALANSGIYIQPRLYVSVLDDQGDRLATSELSEERVSEDGATYVLTNIMQGVLSRGTGKAARAAGFERDAAGKTGTSNDARDAWFVGFTPNLVAGVWVGNDDNSPLGLTGGAAAAPIWGEFMRCSSAYLPNSSFVAPATVSFVEIDAVSGGRATEECPSSERITEVFVQGTEPRSVCPLHPGEIGSGEAPGRYNPHGGDRARGFWGGLFGQ